MRPTEHILFGGVASALLYPALGATASLTFFTASVAVDIDHYLDYIYHNGFTDFGVKKMFEYHGAIEGMLRRPDMLNVEIFHTMEFMLPLFALSSYLDSSILSAVFFGILFHIMLDWTNLIRRGLFFRRCNSITEYIIRRRVMARSGLIPRTVYTDAIDIINNRKYGRQRNGA